MNSIRVAFDHICGFTWVYQSFIQFIIYKAIRQSAVFTQTGLDLDLCSFFIGKMFIFVLPYFIIQKIFKNIIFISHYHISVILKDENKSEMSLL